MFADKPPLPPPPVPRVVAVDQLARRVRRQVVGTADERLLHQNLGIAEHAPVGSVTDDPADTGLEQEVFIQKVSLGPTSPAWLEQSLPLGRFIPSGALNATDSEGRPVFGEIPVAADAVAPVPITIDVRPANRIQAEDHLTAARMQRAFWQAREERFEDGMDSDFGRQLVAEIKQCGETAVVVARQLVMNPMTTPSVAAEALRWIAEIDDARSLQERRALLLAALVHVSPEVRDRASLGLGTMRDKSVLPFLKAAIRRETVPELREDMHLVLAQLQN